MSAEDIHTRIQNTIAVLNAEARTLDEHGRHDVHIAVETLQAAESAITELEAELDLVTAPDLSAAEEAQKLRHALEAAELKVAMLEQQVHDTKDKLQMEDQIHAEEHTRLRELEKQAKEMEGILEKDADAFGKFMDRALDKDAQKGRLKPRD